MLKKYKILMVLISLVLAGIIVIISVWLYGAYKSREEILVSEVERSLFNSIQTYYATSDGGGKGHNKYWGNRGKEFFNEVIKVYPEVDSTRLQVIWDSLSYERHSKFGKRYSGRQRSYEKGVSESVPYYILQNMEFDQEDIFSINKLVRSSLNAKSILTHVNVEKITLKEKDLGHIRKRYEVMEGGDICTRLILINPESNQFLKATIKEPFFDVFLKISLQLITSVVLLLVLIGTFSYLFYTVNKQYKMAVLRKSFVNNMTHELKTPIATVMAAIEAVQRYGARNDKLKMEKYLTISHRELEYLSEIVERVLQLDRDEVNGIVLDKVRFDLNKLIQESIETIKLSSKKPLEINFRHDQSTVWYTGDPSHFRNVINNLLDNAVKYSKETVWIGIDLEDQANEIIIRVADHGIGIASNYLEDIFDMFFRVPHGNLYSVKGFGLGLSYVRQIIDKHGGYIKVSSVENEGTVFKIILPK